MVYITRQTPSNYRNRHSDWYYGVFRDVVHQIGLVGEALFWLDCEGKCSLVDSLIPDWFPLTEVQKAFISLFKSHYNSKYTQVYDEWALQACKSFEVLEGQVNNVLGQIKGKVDEAKAYIDANLIKPIRDKINNEVLPQLNAVLSRIASAETSVRDILNKVNSELEPMVKDVSSRIKSAETSVRDAQTKINNALSDITKLDSSITSLDAKVRNATSQLENFATRLGEADKALRNHEIDIKELFERVRTLEVGGVAPTAQPFSFEELVKKVKEALS